MKIKKLIGLLALTSSIFLTSCGVGPAVKELKRRYDKVYILYDNDEAGEKDSTLLAESTGFIKLTLPKIEELGNPKDISDLYKAMKDKQKFKETILKLFET